MTKSILFLTEAGDGIGFGHYMRCQALLKGFKQNGAEARMVLKVQGIHHFDNAEQYDWIAGKNSVLKYADHYEYLFIDSYLASETDYLFFSTYFSRLVVMDDYERLAYRGVDLIINPNIYGSDLSYTKSKAQRVGGKDYIILRKAFQKARQKCNPSKQIQKVLITLGGSDIRNLIPALIELVSSRGLEVTVVAGNDEYRKKLNTVYSSKVAEIISFADADTMLTKMLECDICISACGQTLHELAYLGVPAIGICIGDDQILNMKKYCELGFLSQEIYWDQSDLEVKILDSISFLKIQEQRIKVSRKGISIVGSHGIKNIFDKIFNHSQYGDLLRATIKHQNFIAKNFVGLNESEKMEVLKMRNHEQVRRWMLNSDLIQTHDHLAFIESLKSNDFNFYWLVKQENGNENYGVIYINKLNEAEKSCEFGIYSNPFKTAPGMGTILANMELYIIFEVAGLEYVTLEVQEKNEKAQNLYGKLGFVKIRSNVPDFIKMILHKKDYRGNKK
jgi:UDP-2,4-diacetamido-2,4,6-trideoxy-beta-L-altropyranose hydrolase